MKIADKLSFRIAILLGALTVIIGAFGAHGLQKKDFGDKVAHIITQEGESIKLTPIKDRMLQNFQTGVRYQAWHCLAILILSLIPGTRKAIYLFTAGIILFSGSLYAMTLLVMPKLGMVTPIGGLLFILGWISLFFIKEQQELES